MDISKICRLLGLPANNPPPERVTDNWIRAALMDEALAPPPSGSWERLRKAILERKPVRSRGMWVLDEPLRDPPEVLTNNTLTEPEFVRAQWLYDDYRGNLRGGLRELAWNSFLPAFAIVVNW
jgi:hypothetical protein